MSDRWSSIGNGTAVGNDGLVDGFQCPVLYARSVTDSLCSAVSLRVSESLTIFHRLSYFFFCFFYSSSTFSKDLIRKIIIM